MAEIKKTLGGDRLGGENKMQVELHGFNRSSHDISRVMKTPQAVGSIVPCFVDVATDGTDYYIELDSKIRTLPTTGPIFGIFKHQIDVFKIPIRLYNAELHNNQLGVGLKMSEVKLPMTQYNVQKTSNKINPNTDQIAQDSLSAYLGLRGLGHRNDNNAIAPKRLITSIYELAYWDIYKNYYANKQEEIGYVISGGVKDYPMTRVEVNGQDTMATTQPVKTETATAQNGWALPTYFKFSYTSGGVQQYIKFYFTNGIPNNWETLPFYVNGPTGKPTTLGEFIKNGKLESYDGEDTAGSYIQITWGIGSSAWTMKDTYLYPQGAQIVKEPTGQILEKFELSNIDNMREAILKAPKGIPYIINGPDAAGNELPYAATNRVVTTSNQIDPIGNGHYYKQAGLGIKTYLSDRFNNWLSTEWIDGVNGVNEITAVKVEDGTISMDALILQKKLYYMMNRIAISGGSYNDWREAVYGQKTMQLPESPIYEGGASAEIYFEEVIQTSDNGQKDNPLGSLAGRGTGDNIKRGGEEIHVHIDEPSILMILESITPRLTYSQGNKWYTALKTLDDLHKPNLDAIGFQELITEEMAAFDTLVAADGTITTYSAGKQPSWIQYQTNVDEAFGDFSTGGSLEFMTLNRDYTQEEEGGQIQDLTTYIDPTMYNKAFAGADLDAQNFWIQIGIKCTARRVMAANQIPNL